MMPEDQLEKLVKLTLTGVTMLLLIEQGREEQQEEPDVEVLRAISAFMQEEQALLGEDFKFNPRHDGGHQ